MHNAAKCPSRAKGRAAKTHNTRCYKVPMPGLLPVMPPAQSPMLLGTLQMVAETASFSFMSRYFLLNQHWLLLFKDIYLLRHMTGSTTCLSPSQTYMQKRVARCHCTFTRAHCSIMLLHRTVRSVSGRGNVFSPSGFSAIACRRKLPVMI